MTLSYNYTPAVGACVTYYTLLCYPVYCRLSVIPETWYRPFSPCLKDLQTLKLIVYVYNYVYMAYMDETEIHGNRAGNVSLNNIHFHNFCQVS